MQQIVVKGGYGHGNFGDDALMVVCYEVLRRVLKPEEIVFVCNSQPYLSKLVGNAQVESNDQLRKRSAPLLVFGGGTQFYSFSLTTPSNALIRWSKRLGRAASSPYKYLNRLLRLLVKTERYAHTAALGVGLGPFVEDSQQKAATEKLFRKMDFVAVRDFASYDTCQSWGICDAVLGADLCFLPDLWRFRPVGKSPRGTRRSIGIIVRDWSHTLEGAAYEDAVWDLVSHLRKSDYEVTFISFAPLKDKTWTRKLAKEGESVLRWDPMIAGIESFLKEISSFDCLITGRYHGAVFGAILNKPIICIEVEPKLRLVAELLGDGGALWEQPFKVSECLAHLNRLLENYSAVQEALSRVVSQQSSLAQCMVDSFVYFLSTTLGRTDEVLKASK